MFIIVSFSIIDKFLILAIEWKIRSISGFLKWCVSLGVKHLGGSPFIGILPVGFTKAWETAWMSSEWENYLLSQFPLSSSGMASLPRECDDTGFDETKILRQKCCRQTLWVPLWAEYIVTENLHKLHPCFFETSTLDSLWETIVFSHCCNESHPFPIKMTLTRCISGWLKQTNKCVFKKQLIMLLETLTHIKLKIIRHFVNESLMWSSFPSYVVIESFFFSRSVCGQIQQHRREKVWGWVLLFN